MRDGKRNLDAPTPEPRGGSEDLSGIWHLEHSLCAEDGGCGDYVSGPEFRDIASGFRAGCPTSRGRPD